MTVTVKPLYNKEPYLVANFFDSCTEVYDSDYVVEVECDTCKGTFYIHQKEEANLKKCPFCGE